VDNVPCQKSAMNEDLNMTPKLKWPSKSELIDGVTPNGVPIEKEGWMVKDEGGDTSERRERMRSGNLHRFISQPQRINGGPDGG
jgi:hypothetical protein